MFNPIAIAGAVVHAGAYLVSVGVYAADAFAAAVLDSRADPEPVRYDDAAPLSNFDTRSEPITVTDALWPDPYTGALICTLSDPATDRHGG